MKYVYSFTEGTVQMKELLGRKGATLSELTKLGLPIPEGFVVTTEACSLYYAQDKSITKDLEEEIFTYIQHLEKTSGKKFGDAENPLFISVRASSNNYMERFFEDVLNIGINDTTAKALAKTCGNKRFPLDLYINFLIPFMNSILEDTNINEFEAINHKLISAYYRNNKNCFGEFSDEAMEEFIIKTKQFYKRIYEKDFPDDPRQQLLYITEAVFRSCDSIRAQVYKRLNEIDGIMCAAVVVQKMVFGNASDDSAVGYLYTRNPKTGENKAFTKLIKNTQRKEIPYFYDIQDNKDESSQLSESCFNVLITAGKKIEKHYKDCQCIDFVLEKNTPYIMMSTSKKLCMELEAELNIIIDLVQEGIISKDEAIERISRGEFRLLSLPVFDEVNLKGREEIAQGFTAFKGVAYGKVYFSEDKAREHINLGEKVIIITRFIRGDEKGEEIIQLVDGVVSSGGMSIDQAIMARNNEKPCIVIDRTKLNISKDGTFCILNDKKIIEGDIISVDATIGKVYKGITKIIPRPRVGNYGKIIEWISDIERSEKRQ
jgi:pyruvate,orthophosphate dikinase